jgi:hypothetical protein
VPISTLLKFNRLRALSDDSAVVAEALRQSKELLEVDEAGENVRRVKQLGERRGASFRSVHVVSFGTYLSLPLSTQSSLLVRPSRFAFDRFQEGFPLTLTDPLSAIQSLFSPAGKIEFVKVFWKQADGTDAPDAEAAEQNAAESAKPEGEAAEGTEGEKREKKEKVFAGQAFIEFSDQKEAKKCREMEWSCEGQGLNVVSKWVPSVSEVDQTELERSFGLANLAVLRSNSFRPSRIQSRLHRRPQTHHARRTNPPHPRPRPPLPPLPLLRPYSHIRLQTNPN